MIKIIYQIICNGIKKYYEFFWVGTEDRNFFIDILLQLIAIFIIMFLSLGGAVLVLFIWDFISYLFKGGLKWISG